MLPIRWIRSILTAGLLSAALAAPLSAHAQASGGREENAVSPQLGIQHPGERGRRPDGRPRSFLVRSIDGTGNNRLDSEMGAAFTPLRRLIAADYEDGASGMAWAARTGPREISNAVHHQAGSRTNPHRASDYLWQWGQFVDHDISFTGGADPPELAPIPVPAGDPWFDPFWTDEAKIPFNRSVYDEATGDDPDHPRAQMNEITAWIDASNVYGSNPEARRCAAHERRLGTDSSPARETCSRSTNVGLPNAGGSDPNALSWRATCAPTSRSASPRCTRSSCASTIGWARAWRARHPRLGR